MYLPFFFNLLLLLLFILHKKFPHKILLYVCWKLDSIILFFTIISVMIWLHKRPTATFNPFTHLSFVTIIYYCIRFIYWFIFSGFVYNYFTLYFFSLIDVNRLRWGETLWLPPLPQSVYMYVYTYLFCLFIWFYYYYFTLYFLLVILSVTLLIK